MSKRRPQRYVLKSEANEKSDNETNEEPEDEPTEESNNITFRDIDDKFSYGNYYGLKIVIMKSSGYINVTHLCNEAIKNGNSKKPFRNWLANSNSKKILAHITNHTELTKDSLFSQVVGGRNTLIRGTYAHPMLLTHIAMWCSTEFNIKVCSWIEEWKKYSKENNLRYWDAIKKLNSDSNDLLELKYKKKLHKRLGGEIEVSTSVGNIDLLTKTDLIEIKTYDNWKYALGQLIAYSSFYPRHQKTMYLFSVPQQNNLVEIRKICKKTDVRIKTL